MPKTVPRLLLLAVVSGCAGTVGEAPDQAPGAGGRGQGPAPAQPEVFACRPGSERLGGPRIWRLTARQYNATVARLFGAPVPAIGPDVEEIFAGGEQGGFLNGAFTLRVQEAQAGQLRKLARAIAAKVVADPTVLARTFEAGAACPPGAVSYARPTCVDAFVRAFGLRAFRRPIDGQEATGLAQLFALARDSGAGTAGTDAAHLGVRAVVEAVLQSPSFLYRTEIPSGTGRLPLPPHDLASALSYFLTDDMPDAALLTAAARAELATPAQVEAQARRLLAAAGRPAVAELYRQWLGYEDLQTRSKDETLFPEWEKLRPAMAEELRRFVESVVFDGSAKYRDLFEASHTFVDADLAPIYGVKPEAQWRRVSLDPAQRAGVLTLSGLMAITSELNRTSPVARGLRVQERFYCTEIPDPPAGVDVSLPEPAAGLTRRQQLELKTSAPLCGGCHGLINGIGFGLENLDGIGRWRDRESGVPIDPRGTIRGTHDSDGEFVGPRGLAVAIAKSGQARECLLVHSFRYALGRTETVGDACALGQALGEFRASDFDLKTLLVAIAKTDAFRKRDLP